MLRFSIALLLLATLTLAGCGSQPRQNTPLPVGTESVETGGQEEPDDPDAQKEFTTTESGLKYRILRKGNDTKPTPENSVVAHYRGWLDNGNEFDSSYQRGEPTEFPLNGVIPGWTEGLQLIGEGGKIELEIPPELGYRDQAAGTIPPNSTLHFIVELKKVR